MIYFARFHLMVCVLLLCNESLSWRTADAHL